MSLLHRDEPPETRVNDVLAVEGHWLGQHFCVQTALRPSRSLPAGSVFGIGGLCVAASPENKPGDTVSDGPPCAASAVEKKRMLDDCRKTQSQQQAAASTPWVVRPRGP
jgi:hypothetical protein